MTIHYFYLIAGYGFWLYIILYITVRMLSQMFRENNRGKYFIKIEKFFKPSSKDKNIFDLYKIAKIDNDDSLFNYSCECYLRTIKICSEEEKRILEKALTRIVNYKIFKTTKHNRLTRCLIIACINRCSLKSKMITQFIKSCQKSGEAQRQWLLYTQEFDESLLEEVEKWNS